MLAAGALALLLATGLAWLTPAEWYSAAGSHGGAQQIAPVIWTWPCRGASQRRRSWPVDRGAGHHARWLVRSLAEIRV
jgi:hypothetical protein